MPYRYNAITGELDLVMDASATGGITQIDMDSGSITPIAGVVNLDGENGISTLGSSNNGLISSTGFITPYVVSQDSDTDYSTIQSALDAANAAGGGTIFVRGGVYAEDLTCYPNITVTGPGITSGYPGGVAALEIQGNHTPATSGIMTFNNVTFTTAVGDTFNSNAAGTAELNFSNCGCGVTNGYFVNIPNWTGVLSFWDFNPSLGTNDGGINNPTGGAPVYCYEAGVGIGSTQTMQISGTMVFNQGEIMCPVQFNSGTSAKFANNIFGGTITIADDAQIESHHSYHDTGSTAAITMNSSSDCFFTNAVIETSNNPAITGSGGGTLSLSNISFLNNSALAGTLTLGTSDVYPTRMGNGQLLIGQAGQAAVTSTLTAGTNISIVNGPGSITISSTASQEVTITSVSTSPYTVLSTDYYLSVDSSGGAIQIEMPDAPATGTVFVVKDATGSASSTNITITTVGGVVTIDGATTFVMNTDYEAANFVFNGTSYEVF